jgi:hypothetical protein
MELGPIGIEDAGKPHAASRDDVLQVQAESLPKSQAKSLPESR